MVTIRIFLLQTIGGFGGSNETGGGNKLFAGLSSEWTRLGNEVVYVTNASDMGSSFYGELAGVFFLKSFGHSFIVDMFCNFFIQKKKLYSIMEAQTNSGDEQTIVVASSSYPSDVLAAFFVRSKLKLPVVVAFHHLSPPPWSHPFRRGGLLRVFTNYVLNELSLALVKVGNIMPAFDQPRELNNKRWHFHTGLLKTNNFLRESERKVNNSSEKKFDACFIGRIAPNKGIIDLLLAWEIVVSILPKAQLYVAGKCYNHRFEKRVKRLASKPMIRSSVTMNISFLPDEEKESLLDSSKLFVYPSYEEGWSLSVMEAINHGVIPVTYDLIAYDYIGPRAVKVKTGDIEQLANTIVSLLVDDERRCQLSSALYSEISKYKVQDIAKSVLSGLKDFMNTGHVKFQ